MRVLISGVTGFVGRHLAAELAGNGFEVWGFAPEPAAPGGGSRSFELDLRDRDGLAALVARSDPEVIVHLAALSHVGESWQRPGDYLRVISSALETCCKSPPGGGWSSPRAPRSTAACRRRISRSRRIVPSTRARLTP